MPEGKLWRSRIDGSEKLQLTSGQMFTSFARWSPDGQEIAYVSAMPGHLNQVAIVGRDGGTAQVVHEFDTIARPTWRGNGGNSLRNGGRL